jgi:hypothetical protein
MIGKISFVFSIIVISIVAYRLLTGVTVSPTGLIVVLLIVLIMFGTLSYVSPDRLSIRRPVLEFDPPYSLEYKKEPNSKEGENPSSSSENGNEG